MPSSVVLITPTTATTLRWSDPLGRSVAHKPGSDRVDLG